MFLYIHIHKTYTLVVQADFELGDSLAGVLAEIVQMHLHYLGDRLSFFIMLRWKREGARQTAKFIGVIWFSSTEEVTSFRKHRSVCRTSRFSSAISMIAARTACKRCSLGTSGCTESSFRCCYLKVTGLILIKLSDKCKLQDLTLVYMKEGFSHFVREKRFR